MRTPATSVSKARSYSPSKCDDVGRGAAHVEADQAVEAGLLSGLRHADHAAGRAGQDGVLALEQFGGGQTARRHHEHQAVRPNASCIEILVDLRHVAPQDRREIGVDHRGVAAADQLDQRRDLVADRNLRKAQLARQRRHLPFVLRIAVGVHEDDRDRVDAVGLGALQIAPHGGEIGRALHRAVGAHALVDLDDALVEHVRLDDVPGKDLRPRLVADLQRVAEAFGDRAAACARPCARAAHWWRPSCPSSPRRRARPGSARRAFRPSRSRMPCTAASRIGFGIFRQQLVRDAASRPGARPMTSVKVPPRSIQKSQSCGEVFLAMDIELGHEFKNEIPLCPACQG